LTGGPGRAVQRWEVGDSSALRPLEIETIINSVKKIGKVLIVDVAVKAGYCGREVPGPNNPDLDKAAVTQVEGNIEKARELEG
jgi:pyruvate/2-oxoglutarate/acetoin dehydrogenase E1 component